ncbi:MAG: hypothetical protein KKF89_04565, partial [Nanoarchaeota archaeon]|nr:hypothetical protein [Nanoarchaeota archaeon]
MNMQTIGVRGDNHSRPHLTENHIFELRTGKIQGLVDVGDIEASYIDTNQPLRAGQDITSESTMDAIIRNALDGNEQLTKLGREVVVEDIRSITEMSTHNRLYDNFFFRCIQGNSQEVKTKIFDKISPNMIDKLNQAFSSYDW